MAIQSRRTTFLPFVPASLSRGARGGGLWSAASPIGLLAMTKRTDAVKKGQTARVRRVR